MARPAMPKAVKEDVLAEYSHLCAVCAKPNPQLHHIDEDNTNNDRINLLPLCPNHHLSDQHNPTRRIAIPKLQIFRKHKDPYILLPQFDPIYVRQLFLDDVQETEEPVSDILHSVDELVAFVKALKMGEFYGQQVATLAGNVVWSFFIIRDNGPTAEDIANDKKQQATYRRDLIANREKIKALLVELIRYQDWPPPQSEARA